MPTELNQVSNLQQQQSTNYQQMQNQIINITEDEHPLLSQYRKAIELLEEVNKKLIKEKRKRKFWQEKVRAMLRCQLFRKYQEEQIQMEILKDTYDMLRCEVEQQSFNQKIKQNGIQNYLNNKTLDQNENSYYNNLEDSKDNNQTCDIEICKSKLQRQQSKIDNENPKINIKVKKNKKDGSLKICDKSKKIGKKKHRKNIDQEQPIIVFPTHTTSQIKQQQLSNKLSQSSARQSQQTITNKKQLSLLKSDPIPPQQILSQSRFKKQQNSQKSVNRKQRTQAIDDFLKESIRQAKESLGTAPLPIPSRFNQQPSSLSLQQQQQKLQQQQQMQQLSTCIRQSSTVEICDENSNQSVILMQSNPLSQCIDITQQQQPNQQQIQQGFTRRF